MRVVAPRGGGVLASPAVALPLVGVLGEGPEAPMIARGELGIFAGHWSLDAGALSLAAAAAVVVILARSLAALEGSVGGLYRLKALRASISCWPRASFAAMNSMWGIAQRDAGAPSHDRPR